MNASMSSQNNRPGVSVIIPTYNRADFLCECINTVLPQLGDQDEVIVVDDGSQDHTRELLDTYGHKIKTLYKENNGKSAALNMAMSFASRPLVWIIDDDDVVCPDALQKLYSLLAENRHADFVYGRHMRFRQERPTDDIQYLGTGYWAEPETDALLITTLEDFFAHQPGLLVKRALYDLVGSFDESLDRSIDYDMFIRLAAKGRGVATNQVVFHQRIHEGARGSKAMTIESSQREQSWLSHDKRVLSQVHASFGLERYLPVGIPFSQNRRRAYLQRGAIMARKKLWGLALNDFLHAQAISRIPLTQTERQILRRAMLSKYGCLEVISHPEISQNLTALANKSAIGRQIAQSLARGLVWTIRRNAQTGKLKKSATLAYTAMTWVWPFKAGKFVDLSFIDKTVFPMVPD